MMLYIYVYAYVYVCTYLDVCICTQHNTYCTCQRRAVFPTLLWQHTAMNKFTNQLGRHHMPTQVPRRLVAYPCLVYYNTTMKANKVSMYVCLYYHVNSTNHSLSYSGKLSREKTLANLAVLWLFAKVFSAKYGGWCPLAQQKWAIHESFFCIFCQFAKVFSLKNFLLYGIFLSQVDCVVSGVFMTGNMAIMIFMIGKFSWLLNYCSYGPHAERMCLVCKLIQTISSDGTSRIYIWICWQSCRRMGI